MANKLINFKSALSGRRGFSTASFLELNGTTHYPVMYREIFSFVEQFILDRSQKDISPATFQMLDGTFGGGNHSVGLLKKHKNLRILGVDMDSKVLNQCKDKYSDIIKEKRLALEHSNYVNAPYIDVK
jgi:16S rRNA C1402 N4-methylase RsmH